MTHTPPAPSSCTARDKLTRLLHQAVGGKGVEADAAFAAVYDALRAQARSALLELDLKQSMQATDLANATFLKMIRQKPHWAGRERFLTTAAHAMRSILVDQARRRSAQKRTATVVSMKFDVVLESFDERMADILEVDEALKVLMSRHPRAAQVVELRFFGGFDLPEIARVLDMPLRTAELDWKFAKAWLHAHLG